MLRRIVMSVCLITLIFITGCSERFTEKDIIGRNADEIRSIYGEFDIDLSDQNGTYRNCKCGYTLEESKQGFLDSSEEILLYIYFDENGIAEKCEKAPRPGG